MDSGQTEGINERMGEYECAFTIKIWDERICKELMKFREIMRFCFKYSCVFIWGREVFQFPHIC